MAISGFEGFEKRLELQFSGGGNPAGLRRLNFSAIRQVLDTVQCSIISGAGNRFFDSYVLSESSLFVYPYKIIIKTCGTTQLLKSVPCLLNHASHLGLTVCGCRYTRGSFIFPNAQPFPHTNFREEVLFLEDNLPSTLCHRKACVLPSKTSHSWHLYSARGEKMVEGHSSGTFTMEVCMTDLDRGLARNFFRREGDQNPGDVAGREMTRSTGIVDINPDALVCDFAFDPCGYSMNGIDGAKYLTIHVTPEDGYSYASFECNGGEEGVGEMLKRVAAVFRPGTLSVAITGGDGVAARAAVGALEAVGLERRSCRSEDFPAAGKVVFQTFRACRK